MLPLQRTLLHLGRRHDLAGRKQRVVGLGREADAPASGRIRPLRLPRRPRVSHVQHVRRALLREFRARAALAQAPAQYAVRLRREHRPRDQATGEIHLRGRHWIAQSARLHAA